MATEVNLLVVRDLVRIIRPTTGPVHREIGSVSGSISKIVMASVTVTSQRSLEIQRPFRASTPTATLLASQHQHRSRHQPKPRPCSMVRRTIIRLKPSLERDATDNQIAARMYGVGADEMMARFGATNSCVDYYSSEWKSCSRTASYQAGASYRKFFEPYRL